MTSFKTWFAGEVQAKEKRLIVLVLYVPIPSKARYLACTCFAVTLALERRIRQYASPALPRLHIWTGNHLFFSNKTWNGDPSLPVQRSGIE